MRKLFDYLLVLLILLATNGLIHAQDFTVKIESTDACNHYITPIKAGNSHEFQINVKNNRSDTCTVTLLKNDMGEVSSWVTIDTNDQTLFPSQSKNFNLTIDVPYGTCDCDFTMWLYFDAYDKDGQNHSFEYDAQVIIVDNSPPSSPTFTVSQTSKTISVYSWFSWDSRSSTYSTWSDVGIEGIDEYKLEIVAPNGTTIVKNKTMDAKGDYYYTFDKLNSNTNYKARVTAIDLVGNSKATEKSATTAPAAPTGLAFSNIYYFGTTLSWTPSAGATGYNVYKVVGQSLNLVNSSPVTGNSLNIMNREPNTKYEYCVRATSNVGLSDPSSSLEVTTLELPTIIGSDNICSYTNSTYSLSEFLSGASVIWSGSKTLRVVSGQGTPSAIYQANRNGATHIDAVITLSSGETINLIIYIYVGTRPPAILLCPAADYPYFNTHLAYGYVNEDYYLYAYGTNLSNNDADYRWKFYSSDPFALPVLGTGREIEYKKYIPGDYKVSLQYNGECGWSNETFRTIRFEYNIELRLSIYPNPAIEETTLSIESVGTMAYSEDELWDVEIYSSSKILKEKKNKIRGKEVKIKTNGWKTGIYFVRVKYKDLILENKLIVK